MNSQAVHNDPDIFPEPDKFKPERWAGKPNAGSNGDSQLLFTFGAVRRIYPRQHLAERGLFLVISHWLWAFDTVQATDDEKNKVPIDRNDLRPAFIVCLNPFVAKITPRSPGHSRVIEDTWKEELDVSLDKNLQWKATPDGIARLIERVGKEIANTVLTPYPRIQKGPGMPAAERKKEEIAPGESSHGLSNKNHLLSLP